MGKKRHYRRIGSQVISLLLAVAVFCQMAGAQLSAAQGNGAELSVAQESRAESSAAQENRAESSAAQESKAELSAAQESRAVVPVTRLEWLKTLTELFEFTVEKDNYPDNYYADIDASSPDYYEVMLATEFGLIDVEAGEELRPDDAATREFAAHTLNLCLGYVLEEENYTFSEAANVTYPEDIQIAVNQGWLPLVNGSFLPDQPVTKAEKEAMVTAARTVIANDADTSEKDTYTYKSSVIVLPEDTVISSEDENTFLIKDCPAAIREGDIFGKVCDGIPLAWRAAKVEISGNETRITTGIVSTEEAFDEISVTRTNKVDLAKLQPAAEGATLRYVVGGTEEEHYEDGIILDTPEEAGEQEITAVLLEQTIDMPTAYAEFPVGNAKVKVDAVISNLDYKTDYGWGRAGVDFTFKVDFNCTINVDLLQAAGISPSYELFYAEILPGLYVKGMVDLSFYGSANVRLMEDVKLGFHYENFAPRLVREFKKDSFTVTANATMRTGVRMEAGFHLVGLTGKIYGKMGANITAKAVRHTDGKKPDVCQTISTYFYASVGYDVTVDVVIYKGTLVAANKDIYTQYNSPVRTAFHYEDGKAVPKCTRGTKGMGYGGWGYFSPINTQYYYTGGSSGGTYANGEVYTIFDYALDEKNQATITGYRGNAVNVFIPETLDGYPVVGVGQRAFQNNTKIRSVFVPDCVKTIGNSAFYGCTALERVTLPENEEFTVIGNSAFSDCVVLTSVNIPNSVNSMGTYIFSGCTALESAVLPNTWTILMTGIFQNCTSLKNITLPDSLQAIRSNAFCNCVALPSINISKNVTTIESNAFYNCDALTSITIPNGTTEIGSQAFYDCDALTTVVISDTVKTIGSYCFKSCDALTNLTLGASLTSIPSEAFMDCASVEKLVVPYRVTSIGSNAFKNDTMLTAITIPKSVTSIDSTAFSYPKKLTISGAKDSYAQTFANAKGIAFNPIEVAVDTVTLNKQESNIYPYDTEDLLAVVKPLDYTGDIVFSSSDSEVVSVTQTGRIRAEKTRTATITVQAGDKTATCRVNVLVPVSRIDVDNLTGNGNTVSINTTHQLKWTISPENAANKKVTFSSSDEEIATVDKDGKISCKKAGNVRIYIQSEDGKASRTVYITIVEAGSASDNPQESKKPDNPQESKKPDNPQESKKPVNSKEPADSEKPSSKPNNPSESRKPESSEYPSKAPVSSQSSAGSSDSPVPPPQTSEKPKLKGDVDGNGVLELKDAQITLRAALNLIELNKEEKKAADVDGDDRITLKDAQKILKAALHIIHL